MKITAIKQPKNPMIWDYRTQDCWMDPDFPNTLLTNTHNLEKMEADNILTSFEPIKIVSEKTGKTLVFSAEYQVDHELHYGISKKYNIPSDVQKYGHLKLMIFI